MTYGPAKEQLTVLCGEFRLFCRKVFFAGPYRRSIGEDIVQCDHEIIKAWVIQDHRTIPPACKALWTEAFSGTLAETLPVKGLRPEGLARH